jgi:glycosyltransferase involved in cell wall biosynthesis
MKVHYLPCGSGNPVFNMLYGNIAAVRRKLAELRFDLVHVQGIASLICGLKRPNVLTIHGIMERDVLFRGRFRRSRSAVIRFLENRGRQRAREVIVISPYVKSELAGVLRGRTWDIENPVLDSFFEIRRQRVDGRILYGGVINERKNILGLIEGFALLAARNAGAQLLLAGDGKDSAYGRQCRRRAEELGLSLRVVFLGSLSVEGLQEELSKAACLALCSFQETAPVIIEEAMAVGVPVVASNICGIPFMVEDGVTGRLVDPADPRSIAAGLSDVLESANEEAMSVRSREVASRRFRASVVAQKTYDVYRSVLGART